MALANETSRVAGNLSQDISSGIYALIRRIVDYRAYRSTVAALSRLSAEELADLGVPRCEIARVAHETVYGRA